MRISTDFATVEIHSPTVVTIGSFDGVHLGHQALARAVVARARARGARSVVLTLHPHPKHVLGRDPDLMLLSTLEERLELLAQLGLDETIVLPFSVETARTNAAEFVTQLVRRLGMVELVCTADFAFGYRRQGNVTFLRAAGRELGFDTTVIPVVTFEGERVSSSRLRELVRLGDVREAARGLGRPPSVRGRVVTGDRRGRALGFPTANLELPPDKLFPANGIYAVRVRLLEAQWQGAPWFESATSIGVRPTFDGGGRRIVEVHILDFDADLYGQSLEAHFIERLREERKYDSIAALVSQMADDCRNAREILASPSAWQPPTQTGGLPMRTTAP